MNNENIFKGLEINVNMFINDKQINETIVISYKKGSSLF